MNINVIGGSLGVVALVAILSFHGCHQTGTSPKVTEHLQSPAAASAKPTKPIITLAAKPTKAPVAAHHLRRVLPGGKLDGTVDCARVKSFAEGKTSAQLAVLAAKYHVSKEQLSKYESCLN